MADVKPAASAAAPPAQTSTPPPRYIPGAPAPASKPKTKRKKPAAHGGTEPTVTKTDTPVALLSQVPSVSDLPSELVGAGSDTKEISASRPKSAAEEMVSKRMKLLGKKIVGIGPLTRLLCRVDERTLLTRSFQSSTATIQGIQGKGSVDAQPGSSGCHLLASGPRGFVPGAR
jgi:hypothetical protein